MHKRYWEIDSLRAIAIFMMVTFHTLYQLDYFDIYSVNVHSGFWWWFARVTAGTFVFVVGISLSISYAKSPKISRFLLKGLKVFVWGLAITLVTWIFMRDEYVIFGILHFIGTAIILGYFFIRFRFLNLALGVACIATGVYLHGLNFSFRWLLWMGFTPQAFRTADYIPLLPWFGVVLLGIFCSKLLYPGGKRRFKIPESYNPVTRSLCFLGRHSLLIYIIHQPILLAILLALFYNNLRPFISF